MAYDSNAQDKEAKMVRVDDIRHKARPLTEYKKGDRYDTFPEFDKDGYPVFTAPRWFIARYLGARPDRYKLFDTPAFPIRITNMAIGLKWETAYPHEKITDHDGEVRWVEKREKKSKYFGNVEVAPVKAVEPKPETGEVVSNKPEPELEVHNFDGFAPIDSDIKGGDPDPAPEPEKPAATPKKPAKKTTRRKRSNRKKK